MTNRIQVEFLCAWCGCERRCAGSFELLTFILHRGYRVAPQAAKGEPIRPGKPFTQFRLIVANFGVRVTVFNR